MIDHVRHLGDAPDVLRSRPVSADADTSLANALAAGAAQVLLDLRANVDDGTFSGAPEDLRAAGDAAAQSHLALALAAARPDDAILSEEARDDPRRLAMERVWIVDPLDGTREFAERTDAGTWRDDFAVHVALWVRGTGIAAAAVALPAAARVVDTGTVRAVDPGAADAVLAGRRPMRLAASRTRPPTLVTRMATLGAVELVPMGSTGAKAMAVVDGRVDAYLHAGGQYEWDSAAPVAVALAAGLVATRLDGSTAVYNQADPWCPDLLICHPGLIGHLTALIAAAGPDGEGPTWP